MTEQLTNLAASILSAPITTTGAISPTVASATKFPGTGNFRIRIDSELMLVTARSGATFTVTAPNRGIEGTTAATHLSGVDVRHVISATGLDTRVTETIAALRGSANGYASLDAGAKIPPGQLPASVVEYKGTWNVSTNTPTLSDATGTLGDEYVVSTGATRNLGSGNITWAAGDLAIHNGTIWQKVGGGGGAPGAVTSVATKTGDVTLVEGDITSLVADLAAKATQASVDALTAALAAKADDTDLQVAGPLDSVAGHGALVPADGGKVFVMGASANQVLTLPASGLTESFVIELENTTTAFRLELRSASGSLIETVLSTPRVASVWVKAPWGVARCRFRAAGFWSVSGDISLTATP